MRRTKNYNKKRVALALTGILALTGVVGSIPMSMFQNDMAVVCAADGTEYSTVKGVATMGRGQAHIDITENEGQTLVGKKFNVYKLFNAENAKGGESINYTFNPTYEQALKNVVAKALTKAGTTIAAADVTEYQVIDYIQSLNNYPVEGATADQTLESRYSAFRFFIEELRNEMVKLNETPEVVKVKNVRSDNSIRLDGLQYGYYVIDEVSNVEGTHAASSLCMVNTANPAAQIMIKSDYPSIVKKIQEDDANAGITNADRWNDIGDYEIGQTVPYKFTSNVPDINGFDTYYYAWHDIMNDALTFNKNSVKIEISGKVNGKAKTYTLNNTEFTVTEKPGNGDTFVVAITDLKAIVDREFDEVDTRKENTYGQNVTLTYNATLNDKAAENTGRPGFENDVRLEFSNDADSTGDGKTGYTPWDTVVCFTYRLNPIKTNDHDKVLDGAKFRLYSDADCKNEVYVKSGQDGYIVINRDSIGGKDHTGGTKPDTAVEMVSDANGTFNIYGLDSGTYYLKETDAPDGYRLLKDSIKLELKATFTTARDTYVKGESATDKTLTAFDAKANIKTFYNGLSKSEDKTLTTNVEDGSANITIVNQVGKKLPITGTSTVVVMLGAGVVLMSFAIAKGRKKDEEI